MASLLGNIMGAVGPWDLNAVSATPQYNNMSDEQYQALTNAGVNMIEGGVKNDNWFAPTIGQHYLGLAALGRNNRINNTVGGMLADPEVRKQFETPGTIAPPQGIQTGSLPNGKMATIKTEGGAAFQVAPQYEANFKGLIDDLTTAGYSIDPASSGGYANRTIKDKNGRDTGIPSKHASGGAIDINWNANPVGGRPVSQRGFTGKGSQPIDPILARQLAAKHGLVWGGDFKDNPDPMHFEAPGNFNRTGLMAAAPVQQQQRQTQEAPQAPPVAAGGQVAATPPEVPPTQDGAPATTGGLSGRITDPGIETPQPPNQQVAQAPPNRDDPRFIAQGPPGTGLKIPMSPTLGGLQSLEALLRSGGLSDKDRFEIMSKVIQSHGPDKVEGYGGQVLTDKHNGQSYIVPGTPRDITYPGGIPGQSNVTPEGNVASTVLLPGQTMPGSRALTGPETKAQFDDMTKLAKMGGGAAGAAAAGARETDEGGKIYQQYQSIAADSQRALKNELNVVKNINDASKNGEIKGLRGAWRDKVYQAAKLLESATGVTIPRLASKEALGTDDLIKMFQAEGLSHEARSLASQIIAQHAKIPNFDDTVAGMDLKTRFLIAIHKQNIDIADHVAELTHNGEDPIKASVLHRSVGAYLKQQRMIDEAKDAEDKKAGAVTAPSKGATPAPSKGVQRYYKGQPYTVEDIK